MPFKGAHSGGPPPESPEALYRDLPRRQDAVPGLWIHQGDILREYTQRHIHIGNHRNYNLLNSHCRSKAKLDAREVRYLAHRLNLVEQALRTVDVRSCVGLPGRIRRRGRRADAQSRLLAYGLMCAATYRRRHIGV